MKNFFIVFVCFVALSCSKEEDVSYGDLASYIAVQELDAEEDVIACAASDKNDARKTYVFFYPVLGATDYKCFQTVSASVDKGDFSLYKEVELSLEPVFNGYLQRFVTIDPNASFCIVTYTVDGILRSSQPILLKNETKPTEWIEDVTIDFSDNLNPKFSWQDGRIDENVIYFQVITDAQNNLLSGTYTYDKNFTYYDLENVVLNVTRETPPELLLNNSYSFTMMGVSLDNWVNLVIQKDFQISN